MIRLTDAAGLLSAGLAITAVSLTLLPVWRRSIRERVIALLMVTAAACVPIGGLAAAGYVRAFIGDLSVTSLVLLVLAVGRAVFAWRPFPERQTTVLYALILLSGGIFYPMALGATAYDPYRLGYGSYTFLSALLAVGLIAWTKDQRLLVLCLTLAVLGFVAGWYESTNLWDYLIDPLLVVFALGRLLKQAALRAAR